MLFPMAVSRLNGYRPPFELNWLALFARLFRLAAFRLFAFKSVKLAEMPFSADPFRNCAGSLLCAACVAFGLIMLFRELVVVFFELLSELDGLSV